MSDWRTTLERAQAQSPDLVAIDAVVRGSALGRSVRAVERVHGGLGAVLHRIDLDPHPVGPEAMM